MAGLFIILALVMKRNTKTGFEDWIKQNNLNYTREIVTNTFINSALFNSAAISFTNAIWGLYKNKRIYIYTVIDSSGVTSDKKHFFNGSFYSKLKVKDIDKLLENESCSNKREDMYGACVEIEIPQLLVANAYLMSGTEVDYLTARKIHILMEKLADSKIDFKDKLASVISGNSWKIDMGFNDPKVIDFVAKNYKNVDKETIKQVASAYESFSLKYDARKIKSGKPASLKDIDMSKFR
jgi:hypothetical protein